MKGYNFYVPMWMTLGHFYPLPPACSRLGCKVEFIYCTQEQCREEVIRITHKAAPMFMSPKLESIIGISHTGEMIEYRHNCERLTGMKGK